MTHNPAGREAQTGAGPATSADRVAHLESSLSGLAAAIAGWLDGALGSGDVGELARRIVGDDDAPADTGPFDGLVQALGGDPLHPAGFVTERPAGPLREAARLAAALSLCSQNRAAARALFGQAENCVESLAAAVLYCELGGGWRPEDIALLEIASRYGALSDRAIVARLSLVRLFGPDAAAFRTATLAAIRHAGPAGPIERLAAENVWLARDWAMAQPLLGRFSGLCALAGREPAIADLARRAAWHRVPMSERPAARAFVEAIRRLTESSAAFWKRAADPALRIAVVGNSSCERGLGKGTEIDAHDIVVRFNDAPDGEAFAADYGSRCDVRAFAKRSVARWANSAAETIVMTREDGMLARGMEVPLAIAAAGRQAAFVPGEDVRALRRLIGAAPSTGLIMLHRLRRVRGSLAEVSCYGFSLVDQIAPEPASAHYFTDSRPHRNHAWAAERALLDQWLKEARAGR